MHMKNGWSPFSKRISWELIKIGSKNLFQALTLCINKYLNRAPVSKKSNNSFLEIDLNTKIVVVYR